MKEIELLVIGVLLVTVTACVMIRKKQQDQKPLQTVGYVDLSRYTGLWYEIARSPNRFQDGCEESRATYSLRDDGKIAVVNECYDGKSGKLRRAEGRAWVVDKNTNARLKVSFFWPFSGHYWIIELGKNYEYAVIGHPERKFLWILSRTREMEQGVYQDILSQITEQGYDITRLISSNSRR